MLTKVVLTLETAVWDSYSVTVIASLAVVEASKQEQALEMRDAGKVDI